MFRATNSSSPQLPAASAPHVCTELQPRLPQPCRWFPDRASSARARAIPFKLLTTLSKITLIAVFVNSGFARSDANVVAARRRGIPAAFGNAAGTPRLLARISQTTFILLAQASERSRALAATESIRPPPSRAPSRGCLRRGHRSAASGHRQELEGSARSS